MLRSADTVKIKIYDFHFKFTIVAKFFTKRYNGDIRCARRLKYEKITFFYDFTQKKHLFDTSDDICHKKVLFI